MKKKRRRRREKRENWRKRRCDGDKGKNIKNGKEEYKLKDRAQEAMKERKERKK